MVEGNPANYNTQSESNGMSNNENNIIVANNNGFYQDSSEIDDEIILTENVGDSFVIPSRERVALKNLLSESGEKAS